MLINENSEIQNGFLYPNWEKLHDLVYKQCNEDQYDTVFTELAKEWLVGIKKCLSSDFELFESSNFFLLCDEETHINKNLINCCEGSRHVILEQFAGALKDIGHGKHVLIVFKEVEQYTRYTNFFSSTGEPPSSGGMCIYNGYTHIVLPYMPSDETPDRVIAHELTHALLTNHYIPAWLNEALAMRMEDIVAGFDSLDLNEELYKKHTKFWNETTIQDFWSGAVWNSDSIGFELSYDLARILWKKIAVNLSATKDDIVNLIESTELNDSGNAAIKKIFDYSLGELMGDFLGDGNWEPDPDHFVKNEKLYEEFKVWEKEIEPLMLIDEQALLECLLSKLEPSQELEEFFVKLEVLTIGDLIGVSAESLFRYKTSSDEINFEMFSKLSILDLSLAGQETLQEISDLMFIFKHGKIIRGDMDGKNYTFKIEIKYLAEMIKPGFKYFNVTVEDFGGFAFYPWDDEEEDISDLESLSLDELMTQGPVITGTDIVPGSVFISCELDSEDNPTTLGDFSFHASGFKVVDPEGKEWSMKSLRAIDDEYWAGD